MSAALATLGADQIGANVKAFLHVLGVADHVHVEDAVLMELVDDGFWWDADGGDEEACARLNDDVDEFVELAFGVVVASLLLARWSLGRGRDVAYLVFRAEPPT